MAVLHQLGQEAESVSLHELLKKLGSDYTERSVRRWLSDMINEGLVVKFGSKRGTSYQVIARLQREADSTGRCFSLESSKIIEQVRRPIYERNPIAYSDDWLNAYQPNTTFYIPPDSRIRLEKAGQRGKQEDPAGTYAHQIFNRLLIDLSYNSSRLEGDTYSLLDTERLLLEGSSAEGKHDEEKIMILNHKEAIRYLAESASRLDISEQTICTLHYLLADGLLEARYAGKIRDHGVRIGGSTYLPFVEKNQLKIRFKRIIEKGALIKNPYEQSLFLLLHVSYLQTFSDVNKRTARLCSNIPLIKKNLVPLSFNDVERDDYNTAMVAIYELNDIRPILDLYLFSYMRTCAMYDSTVKMMGFDEVRVRYRQQRRAIIREIILNLYRGSNLKDYISEQSIKWIKEEDRTSFLEDVMEDLREIDLSRIAGWASHPNN
ncbi:MAG: Fic family protein [Candidatus Protochlamydia sp.]|nr:Fic family protein [Candidatus Protochlamydia sp.]